MYWAIPSRYLKQGNRQLSAKSETRNALSQARLGPLTGPRWTESKTKVAEISTCIFEAASDATQANLLSVQAYPV